MVNRRQLVVGIGGLVGMLGSAELADGRGLDSLASAEAPIGLRDVQAFATLIHVGQAVELASGLTVRFDGVYRDSRCPADLRCYVAGSADVGLEFMQVDEQQNTRSFSETFEFPLGRRVLLYDSDEFVVVADLSGDSDVPPADLVLSLYLVEMGESR